MDETSQKELTFPKTIKFKDSRCQAVFEYVLDKNDKLISDIVVTYMPLQPGPNQRPGVIRLPIKFVQQLTTVPLEIQGVETQLLLKVAHFLKGEENI